jgi:hypothetical protein
MKVSVTNFLLRVAKFLVVAILLVPVIILMLYGAIIRRVNLADLRIIFRASYWRSLLDNRVEQFLVGRYVYEPIKKTTDDVGIYQNLPPFCYPSGSGMIICRYAEDAMMLKLKHNGEFYPLRWK